MNRRRTYLWTLIVFFLMWGIFGFVAAGLPSEPRMPDGAPALQDGSNRANEEPGALIPAPDERQSGSQMSLVHVLFGFIVVFGVLALLNAANKPATTYVRHKHTPDKHNNNS